MPAISFIKPNYPGEKRVALLPTDLLSITPAFSEIIVESGFGQHLGAPDKDYIEAGCKIADRATCFSSEYVFSLKLIQQDDYKHLRQGAKVIGWMHPLGSGKTFCETVVKEKEITIFDIDSVYPRIYEPSGDVRDITCLPRHFFWENSYLAGIAATELGIQHGVPSNLEGLNCCVLGAGSVSQGAFQHLSSIGLRPRMFYRNTLDVFQEHIGNFDIIVNGIEVDVDGLHIINREMLEGVKPTALIIDAAADAGRAIYGTTYQSLSAPIGTTQGRRYALVNNAPTLRHEEASKIISKVVSSLFLKNRFF